MNRNLQITYMQIRLLRLAAEEWQKTLTEANAIFSKNGVYDFICEYFDSFHIEGDFAILEEVEQYLVKREPLL